MHHARAYGTIRRSLKHQPEGIWKHEDATPDDYLLQTLHKDTDLRGIKPSVRIPNIKDVVSDLRRAATGK